MLTLYGTLNPYPIDNFVIKNPKVGNLETVNTGVTFNTSRQGYVGAASVGPTIKRRRFDFQWLTLQEKENLITWLLLHIGLTVTVEWTHGSGCNESILNEQYIIDDQPLETITVHDDCSYDCMTYWVKV